jgi:hypothetical protein
VTRAWAGIAFGVAWLIAAPPARAQRPDDLAAAETLFAEGSSLVNAGRYHEGCPKLEQAQRLVPGIGVTLYVGECSEERGDFVGAWRQFKEAEDLAAHNGDARQKIARERAERLSLRLARIRVVIRAEAKVPGLTLTGDGAPIDPSRWGGEYAIEPRGLHRVAASAPGRESWERVLVNVGAGEVATVQLPVLRESAVAAAPGSAAAAGPPAPPSPAPASPALPPTRVASYALAGAGVAAVVIGIAFGLDAKSKMDDSNARDCQPDDRCNASGLAARASALDSATASTVAFVGGAAFIAAGAGLYFLSPPKSASVALVPRAGPDGAALALRGRW